MDRELVEPIDLNARVPVNPHVPGGKTVVKNARIPVSLILDLLVYVYSIERVTGAYPVQTESDVRAALAYASAQLDRAPVDLLVGRS